MELPTGVEAWWYFLCALALVNVAAWATAAERFERHQATMPATSFADGRIQLALSAVYVFGCAFRSVLPVYDIPRICLFDIPLSSVAVGRSVATIAELCFVAQWALTLRSAAKAAGSGVADLVSRVLLPLIAVAETCSWYAVLTTSNFGHVAENSIWAVSAALGIVAILAILPYCSAARRRVLIAWCVAGVLYVAFMFVFDVPTYWARHLADEASGRHYLTLAQGIADASQRRVVSYRWHDWQSEVVWMSAYFSIAVWLSISLIHARVPVTRTGPIPRQMRAAHSPAAP